MVAAVESLRGNHSGEVDSEEADRVEVLDAGSSPGYHRLGPIFQHAGMGHEETEQETVRDEDSSGTGSGRGPWNPNW